MPWTRTLLVAVTVFGWTAVPASGDLDNSFGSSGHVLVAFDIGGSNDDRGQALLVQNDGKLVVGGEATKEVEGEDDGDFAVARLHPDGSLDTSFGSGGRQTVSFDLGGTSDRLTAMALYPGERVLLAGVARDSATVGGAGAWAIARLTPSGALDTTFDIDGRRHFSLVPTSPDTGAALVEIAVQADGKIVLCGYTVTSQTESSVSVVRLNADGTFDTSFADQGIAQLHPFEGDPSLALGTAVAALPDGRILVGGFVNTDPDMGAVNEDMFVLQLDSDGNLDPAFGNGGVRTVAFDQGGDNRDRALDLAVDHQGSIVLAGEAATTSTGTDMAVARVMPDGSMDAGFGSSGRVMIGFDVGSASDDKANATVIDQADRIYLAGRVITDSSHDVGIVRLTVDGLADVDFGEFGKVHFSLDHDPPTYVNEVGRALVLDDRERPVIAGFSEVGPVSGYDMLVLRLTSDLLFRDRFEASP